MSDEKTFVRQEQYVSTIGYEGNSSDIDVHGGEPGFLPPFEALDTTQQTDRSTRTTYRFGERQRLATTDSFVDINISEA